MKLTHGSKRSIDEFRRKPDQNNQIRFPRCRRVEVQLSAFLHEKNKEHAARGRFAVTAKQPAENHEFQWFWQRRRRDACRRNSNSNSDRLVSGTPLGVTVFNDFLRYMNSQC